MGPEKTIQGNHKLNKVQTSINRRAYKKMNLILALYDCILVLVNSQLLFTSTIE